MELCLCIITGILHGVFLIVFEMKKPEIASNYSFIQNDFVRWSLRSKMDPDKVYKQIAMIITKLSGPTVILYGFLFFGPLLAAFNDLGKLPLNDRSHFLLYWPEVSLYLHPTLNVTISDVTNYCLTCPQRMKNR